MAASDQPLDEIVTDRKPTSKEELFGSLKKAIEDGQIKAWRRQPKIQRVAQDTEPLDEIVTNTTCTPTPTEDWFDYIQGAMPMEDVKALRRQHKIQGVAKVLRDKNSDCFEPIAVSIGPYHRNKPHLQRMEKLKAPMMWQYVKGQKCLMERLYHEVAKVAAQARKCYAEDATQGMRDVDFTRMMFLDGCFFLQFIMCGGGIQMTRSDRFCVTRDLYLLENQLPFTVLKALSSGSSDPVGKMMNFINNWPHPQLKEEQASGMMDFKCCHWFNPQRKKEQSNAKREKEQSKTEGEEEPIHLLQLLRQSLLNPKDLQGNQSGGECGDECRYEGHECGDVDEGYCGNCYDRGGGGYDRSKGAGSNDDGNEGGDGDKGDDGGDEGGDDGDVGFYAKSAKSSYDSVPLSAQRYNELVPVSAQTYYDHVPVSAQTYYDRVPLSAQRYYDPVPVSAQTYNDPVTLPFSAQTYNDPVTLPFSAQTDYDPVPVPLSAESYDLSAETYYAPVRIGGAGNRVDAGRGLHTYRSATELKKVGIHFRKSQSHRFTDVGFRKNLGLLRIQGELRLPPMYVDDYTKSRLLNLVAYEMCADVPEEDADVTTYLCFLDDMIDCAEDVKELRSNGILINYLGSDQQVADLFNQIGDRLVANSEVYASVNQQIEKHYKNKFKEWFLVRLYTYFKAPWSCLTFLAALIILLLTFIQALYAVMAFHAPKNG